MATGTVAVGVLATMLPLRSIFTDWTWFTTGTFCAAPFWLILAALRLRLAPRWWHSLIGMLGSLLTLLWVFAPQHLGAGVLPTPAAATQLYGLFGDAIHALNTEHAPLVSTRPLQLLVAGVLILLAVLTDVLAILLRRPLLAAAPLLEVLAVASAASSRSAHPVWFAAAAAGFMLIVLSSTQLQDHQWGPSIDGSAGRLGGTRRMAAIGITAALLIPVLLPSASTNLLARAAHHDSNASAGLGRSGQTQLNNFAALRGSLKRAEPVKLFHVQVDPGSEPFYVRQSVLDRFSEAGWGQSPNNFGRVALSAGVYPISPADEVISQFGDAPSVQINAEFTVLGLGGRDLPILANPIDLQSVQGGSWNSDTATVVDTTVKKGMTYTEVVTQPAPTVAQLRDAPNWRTDNLTDQQRAFVSLGSQPTQISELAARLTTGRTSTYDKARSISDYFTNGKNGFSYSLETPPDDGGNALVTFLDKKQGFCQQYAAAAAVLMRLAGLPARVVLGYTHRSPDVSGGFTVTTADAHAWVEVYFAGIGWLSFDPTPLSGTDTGRAVRLPWAPHPAPASADLKEPSAPTNSAPVQPSPSIQPPEQAAQARSGVSPILWQAAIAILGSLSLLATLIFGPRWIRTVQRKRRLSTARTTSSPEPLWLELAATAADRDVLWPITTTVGQVPQWLARHGVDEDGRKTVTAVAEQIELGRFSSHRSDGLPEDFIESFDQALLRWGRRTQRHERLINRWVPRSLRRHHMHLRR